MPPRRPCAEGPDWKWCPDCGRCQPPAQWNAGQSYCKAHQLARASAARAKLLAASETARLRKRAADARYRAAHAAERAASTRDWKRRNPDKVAAWYARWAAENPERRRASQEAYRERRRIRAAAYRFKADHAPRPEYDPRDPE